MYEVIRYKTQYGETVIIMRDGDKVKVTIRNGKDIKTYCSYIEEDE